MTESQRQAALNAMQTVAEEEAEEKSAWDKITGGVGSVLGGVGDALGGVKGGLEAASDWQADLLGYGDAQDQAREISGDAVGQAGEFYEEKIAEPVERGMSTFLQAGNIIDERGFTRNFGDWLDGNTWEEAWDRTEDATFGQSLADVFVDRDLRREGYEAGFDPETGLPLDQNYREMREDNLAYNLFSGTADFVQEWFADPLTVATAGVGRARAFLKGDIDHLGASTRDDVLRITTAPDSALADMKIRKWSPVEQRALAFRHQMTDLRDRSRAGELDPQGLVEEVQAFRTNPAAAAFFYRLSVAKKPLSDGLGYSDEFYDDIFYHGVGAMMGVPGATDKLRVAFGDVGTGLAERIDNLQTTRIPKIDEELGLAQATYDAAVSEGRWLRGPGAMRAQEKALNAKATIDQNRHAAEAAKEQLGEYEDYQRFLNSVDDRIVNAGISMVPRSSKSFGDIVKETASHTYRSPGTGKASTYIKYPRAAFRQRPGRFDLHRDIHGQVGNYLDQVVAYGREGVEAMGADKFEELRRVYMNRAADATTDVERRRIAADLETRGVEIVSLKHGLEPGEARQIALAYSGRRATLFRDIERQAAENRAYSAADAPLTYKWEVDGVVHEMELPLIEAQLGQTFLAMDLRSLDQLLRQHGQSIKTLLRTKNTVKDRAEDFASYFEAWWKPAVLLRGGYIVRNLSDEGLRSLAALDSLASLMDAPKAMSIGAANLPIRAANRIKGAGNRAARRRWLKRQDQEGTPVLRGPADSLREDAGRLKAVERNLAPVERWSQDLLRNRANGVRDPKVPPIVQKIRAADEAAAGASFAVDMATGRRMRNVEAVVPIGDEVVLNDLDEMAIARFAELRSGLLSNPDGVLLVRRTEDGVVVNVGRRGAKYLKKTELIPQLGARPVTIKGRKGASWEAAGAFQPGVGDVHRSLNSSGMDHRAMTSSYENTTANLRAAVDRGKRSVVGDSNHAEAWHQAIEQIRVSPSARARLGGQELESWLKTPEGRKHQSAQRLYFRSAEPYVWQTEIDNHLNALLPTERLREMVRTDQTLTVEDLQQMVDNRREVVPKAIDTTSVDLALGTGVGQALNAVKDKLYNAIATVPSDTLVRNPFFNRMYKHRLQVAADQVEAGQKISRETQVLMERQAREYALRQTRRYMFSAMDHTDLQHTLRFASSFMNAWQDTLVKWGTIIMERPEQFMRLYANGWQNLDKLPFVEFVDSNGLGKDDPDHGELTNLRIEGLGQTMKLLDKVLPGDQSAAGEIFQTWNVNKNGLNSVIQGSPWWLPGTSPFIQVPAAYMMRNSPHLADDSAFSSFMYKYLFPAGVPESPVLDTVFPAAWMTQVRRQIEGVEDPVFNRMMATRTYQQDYQDWIDNGRQGPEPTPEESVEKAEAAQAFMIAARFMSPAGFTPEVKGQFFIDAANRIQAEYGYGEEGYQKFLDEYGEDAWLWWQSTSQSNTGVPATSAGFMAQQKYRDQIEKNPELGLALVGLDTETDEFNYSVYAWQTQNKVSNVDARTQRAPRGPEGTVQAAEESEGWRRWNYWNTKIQAELSARGLKSLRQRGAEDLIQIQHTIRDQLWNELPGWRDAYTSMDTDKSYTLIQQMEGLVDRGESPERPDWHGVEEFLDIHRRIGAELDAREMYGGGSRNIEAEANADLAYAYDVMVGELRQRNLMFDEFFNRFLTNHSMTLGSGGL
ncbi:hypothetical protein C1I92_09965 [Jiangella anatolica]|uniref:Large polyvalent protein associated domain-containing protein n=2 Tax=Jiangella anatolica TaxID=2670374 RepID=A0A2W2CES8_9ACTN|nr:hypothetical protein C1I92_09965 [Jiangella anatolica]